MNNEIKKALYKEKPVATEMDVVTSDNLTGVEPYSVYWAKLDDDLYKIVKFVIPHKEMGETRFEKEVPAQLLIRWLVTEDKEVYGE